MSCVSRPLFCNTEKATVTMIRLQEGRKNERHLEVPTTARRLDVVDFDSVCSVLIDSLSVKINYVIVFRRSQRASLASLGWEHLLNHSGPNMESYYEICDFTLMYQRQCFHAQLRNRSLMFIFYSSNQPITMKLAEMGWAYWCLIFFLSYIT